MANSFHEFARELFADLGDVVVKPMFGGAGIYAEGLMFAMIAEDAIFIKTDTELKTELGKQGSKPFVWTPGTGLRAGEKVEFGYWRLPDAALDDPQLAAAWGRKALNVARAKATSTKKKRPKR